MQAREDPMQCALCITGYAEGLLGRDTWWKHRDCRHSALEPCCSSAGLCVCSRHAFCLVAKGRQGDSSRHTVLCQLHQEAEHLQASRPFTKRSRQCGCCTSSPERLRCRVRDALIRSFCVYDDANLACAGTRRPRPCVFTQDVSGIRVEVSCRSPAVL